MSCTEWKETLKQLQLSPQDFVKTMQEICDRSQIKPQISCLLHLCYNYKTCSFLVDGSVVQYYLSFSGILLLQFNTLVAMRFVCCGSSVP